MSHIPIRLFVRAQFEVIMRRAGDDISLHARKGRRMLTVCFSSSDREECPKLCEGAMTLEKVNPARLRLAGAVVDTL